MVSSASIQEKHRMLPERAPATRRYSAKPVTQLGIDDLLGLTTAPAPKQTPEDWVDFDFGQPAPISPLDAWAEAFGVEPPKPAATSPLATPPAATSQPVAPTVAPIAQLKPGTCHYPIVGGGFECTREGARIILPPIRWPLLPPPEHMWAPPGQPLTQSLATPPQHPKMLQQAVPQQAPIQNPLAQLATPTAQPTKPSPSPLEPAWRSVGGYVIPPFQHEPGERLRRTHEFPILVSANPHRTVWHYCSVMSQHGVLAGHFEVHGLSRADIGGNAKQHRIIVYSRDARPGMYQLAMDTHPEGPRHQPRIFLLHDGQANHYRFLSTRDTTQPKELLHLNEAQAVESGGAGDCLFFSVARGLGFGGHHQQAALRLRRMATSFLFNHPDASLNGDTVALFVSKL